MKEFDMSTISCPIEGCSKSVVRKGYCYGHYMKDWRYGTPTPQHEPRWQDVTGLRFGSLVAKKHVDVSTWLCQCDCGADTHARIGDLNRGTALSCGDRRIHRRTDTAGYTAAHQRVKQDRGRVVQHHCVDCGEQAQHWSYDHEDPDELLAYGISTNPVAYSLNPSHYTPRCVRCHKRFDLGRRDALAV